MSNANDKPVIAATLCAMSTRCTIAATTIFEAAGYEVRVFPATGTGGRTMERQIRDGVIRGVLDITTTELADQLVGGMMAAGPDRVTAAGLRKVPQVISVGALDRVHFGPPETIPERYHNRKFHVQSPTVTLMRTTAEELDAIGKEIAEKACAAGGPTRVLLPLRGLSTLDAEGQPFHDPTANAALFQSLRNWIYPSELLVEHDLHIDDIAFATIAAKTLLSLMPAGPKKEH